MMTERSFIGPHIFLAGPPTFSSVVDRRPTSFTEYGNISIGISSHNTVYYNLTSMA